MIQLWRCFVSTPTKAAGCTPIWSQSFESTGDWLLPRNWTYEMFNVCMAPVVYLGFSWLQTMEENWIWNYSENKFDSSVLIRLDSLKTRPCCISGFVLLGQPRLKVRLRSDPNWISSICLRLSLLRLQRAFRGLNLNLNSNRPHAPFLGFLLQIPFSIFAKSILIWIR